MGNKLLVTKFDNYIISALTDEKGRYLEIDFNKINSSSIIGNIYTGKVQNIVPSIEAAFIEYEKEKIGYLPLTKCMDPVFTKHGNSNKLCISDELVVQIEKEALKSKEPSLTANIEITGKYSIVSRASTGLAFSKKFNDKKLKENLQKQISEIDSGEHGVIIRTNALYSAPKDVIEEIKSSKAKIDEIIHTAPFRPPFTCLHSSPEEFITHIRDINDCDLEKIITDDPEIYEKIKNYLKISQNKDLIKLDFYEDELLPLYKLFSLEKCLKEIQSEKVWLKSGAYIIIQLTEALVSIDVNSGKNSTSKKSDKIFMKINIEAAKEIARQIRLRNLSGIIIVDFINMSDSEQERMLLAEFELFLSKDRIKTTIVDITKLGLVELTRKKVRKSVYEQLN